MHPVLLPLSNVVRIEEALAATPAACTAIADSYVDGVEQWTPAPWGWQTLIGNRRLLNIDHHADDPRFFRRVSSGNLAIVYVKTEGVLPDDTPAMINHTDCDSVISAAILSGLLPPEDRFGDAVIAADHTGAPNAIADLLQALDPLRDFDCSLRNLNLLLRAEPLEDVATRCIAQREAERQRALGLVKAGRFQEVGQVAVAKLGPGERVAGEFLTGLLPDASAIISASPMENGRWETKVRLGLAAPPGATLYSMGIRKLEPNFGGRWNAGSTKRAGGSTVDPVWLAEQLSESLA